MASSHAGTDKLPHMCLNPEILNPLKRRGTLAFRLTEQQNPQHKGGSQIRCDLIVSAWLSFIEWIF